MHINMEVASQEVELPSSVHSDASSSTQGPANASSDEQLDFVGFDDATELDMLSGPVSSGWQSELTGLCTGDAITHHNNNEVATPQVQQFDPRALLNPRTANSKRPASSDGDSDRGRIDPTIAGQVSLVERLHNVQERTASPAKRVKTDDSHKKSASSSSFGGSGLDLQNHNATPPGLSQGPSIDLTMSEYRNIPMTYTALIRNR